MRGVSDGRVMIFGAGGMLGRACAAELQRRGRPHDALRHADLDIGDEAALRRTLAAVRPSLIINTAAFTRVDDCEQQRDHALRINGHAPGVMADVAASLGATLVHISSDYIFGGEGTRPYREEDPPAPDDRLSAYGLSKLEGDRRVMAAGGRHLILRTSWVFGPGGANFVDTILQAATTRPQLKVVNDQRGRPTFAPDLCAALFALLDRRATGVVNVANSAECTWYEFAVEILRQAGIGTPVAPCTTAEYPRPAKRPAYSVLDLDRFAELTGRPLRPWPEALAAHLAIRTAAPSGSGTAATGS